MNSEHLGLLCLFGLQLYGWLTDQISGEIVVASLCLGAAYGLAAGTFDAYIGASAASYGLGAALSLIGVLLGLRARQVGVGQGAA